MRSGSKISGLNKLPFEKRNKAVVVKIDNVKTSDRFGCKPNERSVEELLEYGIVNLDKPSGPTSHQVSSYVKEILGIKKAGHSGTLDPKVTGVLPIALGRATRIVQTLLPAGKEYVCLMHLHKPVEASIVKKVMLNEFVGRIKQLPPIKSAIKRQQRYRTIYYIDIIEISEDNKDVLFRIGCQAGTYIRKLVHDVGERLDVGANMQELRRTKAGPFKEEESFTLQDLKDAFYYYKEEGNDKMLYNIILPVEFAVSHLPKVWIQDSAVDTLCHGANLKVPGVVSMNKEFDIGDTVAIMTLKGELVALGKAEMVAKQILKEKKGLAFKVDKVFMKPGVYPKIE
ncbi:RNA-guided pseudouridylation complex pseudouridine synthase subunit Cbf5 [Candidatus Woesearchaeota archaeon]|nr:MAG: RNA-guided pseudouridylation complex pseudouridine synthase subunit Cbf5 [Candidatus Woesearchaeota archaeon]